MNTQIDEHVSNVQKKLMEHEYVPAEIIIKLESDLRNVRDKCHALRMQRQSARSVYNQLAEEFYELKKELHSIQAIFNHGADDDVWIPGLTLTETIKKIFDERNEALKDLEFRRELFKVQENQLNEVREKYHQTQKELQHLLESIKIEKDNSDRIILSELDRLKRYDYMLSEVMPEDFKDWHENSNEEWPFIAKSVIKSLDEREQIAWKFCDELIEKVNIAKKYMESVLKDNGRVILSQLTENISKLEIGKKQRKQNNMTGAYLMAVRDGERKPVEVEHLTNEERLEKFKDRDKEEILRWFDLVCNKLSEVETTYFVRKDDIEENEEV